MLTDRGHLTATLRSAQEPSPAQMERFSAFLNQKYQREVPLKWERDDSLKNGS